MIEVFKGSITLEQRMYISDMLSQPVLNNEINALDQDVKLKAIEESISDARKKIKTKVIDEAKQVKSVLGVKVSTRDGGQTLDYSTDAEYSRLHKQLKGREKLLKNAWELNQKNPESQLIIDGELIPVVGIKSYTAESVVYSFV